MKIIKRKGRLFSITVLTLLIISAGVFATTEFDLSRFHIGAGEKSSSSSYSLASSIGQHDVGPTLSGDSLQLQGGFWEGASSDATACFTLTTDSDPTGGGTINAIPAPNCNEGLQYSSGTLVSLTASTNIGYAFDNWSGAVVGSSNPVNVTIDSNKTIIANFSTAQTCYSLTTQSNPVAGGTISILPTPNCDGDKYTENALVSLTASSNSDYAFDNWSGDASGTANPVQVTLNGNKNIAANFSAALTCYALTTSSNPPGGGNVSRDLEPNCDSDKYTENSVITLTANPNPGYSFYDWNGSLGGLANPSQITINGDKNVTANFEISVVPQILVDEAHENQLTLDFLRAQEIEAETPWNNDPYWFFLGKLKDNLSDSYGFFREPDEPLTLEQLQNYEAILIPHHYGTLTKEEIDAVKKYIASGGGLILLGEAGYYPPNPELSEAYGIQFDSRGIFAPYVAQDGLNGDLEITNFDPVHPAAAGVTQYVQNWGQSFSNSHPAHQLGDTWNETIEAWRDDNDNGEYDSGEEGVFTVASVTDTGCGRVAAIADNSFSDGALGDEAINDDILRSMLDWVTDGRNCSIQENKILVDELHTNMLTLNKAQAQAIVDAQGWGDLEYYWINKLSTNLIDDFTFDRVTTGELNDTLLENYEALIIPWYFDPLTTSEVQAVDDFVAKGGGLILIGDCAFSNPNPELAANYDLEFMPECLFSPIPQHEGVITDFSYSHSPPILRDSTYYAQNWGQWLQPNYANGEVFWLLDTGGKNAWIDLNWNDQYDSGEEAYVDVVAGYNTGCGRVMAIADDAFGDSNMEWTQNDEFLRDILSWVTSGSTCELSGSAVYLPLLIK